jgi:hypothetical protein
MDHTATTAQSSTARAARVWIAFGFATVAIAAVMSNAGAVTRTAEQSASGAVIALPSQLAVSSDQVDWSKVQAANITPAESVAAYDR